MFISAIAFQKNSVLLLGKKVGRNFWQPSVLWLLKDIIDVIKFGNL